MGAAAEVFVFEGNASPVLAEVAKLEAQLKRTRGLAKEAADEWAKGNQAAAIATRMLFDEQGKLIAQIEVRKRAVQGMAEAANQGANTVAAGAGRLNMQMMSVGYAVDDFVTVLQQPGMGLIPALRASANNVSVLLAGIHPLAVMLPSIGTMALSAGMKFFGMAENSKAAAEAAKAMNDEMERQADHLRKVGLEAKTAAKSLEEYLRMQGDVLDARELAEMNPLKQKEAEAAKAARKAGDAITAYRSRMTASDEGNLFTALTSAGETDLEVTASKARQELEAVRREIEQKQQEFAVARKGVVSKLAKSDASAMLRPISGGIRDRLKDAIESGASPGEASASVFGSMASDMAFGGIRPEIAEALKGLIKEQAEGEGSSFTGAADNRVSKARRKALDAPVKAVKSELEALRLRKMERTEEFMEDNKLTSGERKRLEKEFGPEERRLSIALEKLEAQRASEIEKLESATDRLADVVDGVADVIGGFRGVRRNAND